MILSVYLFIKNFFKTFNRKKSGFFIPFLLSGQKKILIFALCLLHWEWGVNRIFKYLSRNKKKKKYSNHIIISVYLGLIFFKMKFFSLMRFGRHHFLSWKFLKTMFLTSLSSMVTINFVRITAIFQNVFMPDILKCKTSQKVFAA